MREREGWVGLGWQDTFPLSRARITRIRERFASFGVFAPNFETRALRRSCVFIYGWRRGGGCRIRPPDIKIRQMMRSPSAFAHLI